MKYIITVFIFCIVLFLYLHVYFHLKTSNDLEVYTIEKPSKDKFEEICDLRQPVIFQYDKPDFINSSNLDSLHTTYGAFDVKVRDINNSDNTTELYLPLLLHKTKQLLDNDSSGVYISENNGDFLEETSYIKKYRNSDKFLRPSMVSNCMYDIVFGSNDCKTPLRYDINYRNFYLVTEGTIQVRLIPPEYTKYLYLNEDYDNFEFISPVNPWKVQDDYKADFDKLKTMDVTLNKGDIIYIPAYWWYSFNFEKVSSIATFKYRTFMNNIAMMPHFVMSFLQGQNITRKAITKKE